jgi:CheY-like chemotaxis protein
MDSFAQFRDALREVLVHLYDPDYQPGELLSAVIGCDAASGASSVQSEIIQFIEHLEPPVDTPLLSRSRQDHDVLNHRYILKLTQEETAERLHTSVRTMRRQQREATHTLARLLWEHGLAREVSVRGSRREGDATSQVPDRVDQAPDWLAQVHQDLASLDASSAAKVASVGELIDAAIELENPLLRRFGICARAYDVPDDLSANIHPSVLRQVLIMTIARLAHCAAPGEISIQVGLQDNFVQMIATAPAGDGDVLLEVSAIQEMLSFGGGTIELASDDSLITCRIRVPAIGHVSVLVVDDNPDSVHFYRRCTSGTRFRITHVHQGMAASEAITAAKPDVIVLDIVLPDIDGWELLRRLQSDPGSSEIPIIVCTIVPEEQLALALGAVFFLPKPMRHSDLLQTLDQAANLAATAAPRCRASH